MVQRFYPKRCSSCCLAETIANTEELLTEILVRVPATPLVRFKCVSKHWLSYFRPQILSPPHPSKPKHSHLCRLL
ncbi:putative F-box domain-containing protein [Rosa chinensis]|uniref:Putative F-box domain-containing protein n=1 Tax=Rosa chinensis TaxID=74649 RepID=A0A2P6S666_ROSCH|nr:putative F-box domain-containing protein [Rosa chinensis]